MATALLRVPAEIPAEKRSADLSEEQQSKTHAGLFPELLKNF